MDSDDRAIVEAAALAAAEIPFKWVFVSRDGSLVEVRVEAT